MEEIFSGIVHRERLYRERVRGVWRQQHHGPVEHAKRRGGLDGAGGYAQLRAGGFEGKNVKRLAFTFTLNNSYFIHQEVNLIVSPFSSKTVLAFVCPSARSTHQDKKSERIYTVN